jgi:hypothetical protein
MDLKTVLTYQARVKVPKISLFRVHPRVHMVGILPPCMPINADKKSHKLIFAATDARGRLKNDFFLTGKNDIYDGIILSCGRSA